MSALKTGKQKSREMKKENVAVGQLAAREISMDASVVALLSALNGYRSLTFGVERREMEGFCGWASRFHVTPNSL